MDINVTELVVKVYLMKNIGSNESNGSICELIDSTLIKDEKYLEMHESMDFKSYCFNNFYPMESDYIYKEGNIYTFIIRSIDKELSKYIENNMKNACTKSIKVLSITSKIIPRKHIDKIFSITPVILKFKGGYWRKSYSVDDVENRLVGNLKKKYSQYFGIELPKDIEVFNSIKFKNKRPIPTKYKDICLLGDKIELNVAHNPVAQDLAYLSLGTSMGEMGARGFGFTNYIWMSK